MTPIKHQSLLTNLHRSRRLQGGGNKSFDAKEIGDADNLKGKLRSKTEFYGVSDQTDVFLDKLAEKIGRGRIAPAGVVMAWTLCVSDFAKEYGPAAAVLNAWLDQIVEAISPDAEFAAEVKKVIEKLKS